MLNSFKAKKQWIFVLSVFLSALGIRLIFLPYDLPLIIDGLDNFTYSSAINYYGHLPTEWSPPNNGWPIFVSFWFSVINLENTFQYMQLQKILSIIISSLTVIPVYFLCRKFFNPVFSLLGAFIIGFEPHLIQNSLFGISDSLYIFLVASTLAIFAISGTASYSSDADSAGVTAPVL